MFSRRILLLLCALNAVLAFVAPSHAEQRSQIRNVLFIISDDLKASVLGCYGDPFCQTPNIDALAERGMVFDHAYCQATWCAPSRQSLMFSRYEGKAETNLGQHFKDNGWYSARVGKIYHMRVPGDIIAGTNGADVAESWTERFNSPGLEAHTPGDYACLNLNVFTDELENRQSTKMPHRMFVSVEIDDGGLGQADYKAASKAIELMETHQGEPFFLAVGLVRPHYPMVAPRSDFRLYPWHEMTLPTVVPGDSEDIPKLGLASTMSSKNAIGRYPDNQKRMWAAYYASVTFMDRQVGRLLDSLDSLGLRDSTAIVFTSDHGYHLGEHEFWQKSNLHQEVIRVPMIWSVPGMAPGRSNSMAELVDLFPTLAELAGIDAPRSVQGESLVPVLRDPTSSVRPGALSLHKGHSLRVPGWHYMRYSDGTAELYDMSSDPREFTNLVDSRNHRAKRRELDDLLNQRLTRFGIEVEKNKRANKQ